MENNDVFQVKDLCFSYGAKPILRHVNFSIPKGKIVTLMGANGCGKSTLFQLMTKNQIPNQGKILLHNQDITAMRLKDFAKQVAIVHQYNTAPADITIEQLVSYGRMPHYHHGCATNTDLDEKMIARALKITGLEAMKERYLSELSGGQKQRVWIAMALCQGTEILFLDEPTTYLDIRYQLQLLQLIRGLNQHYGTTIIMVLHDINQAMAYSDEIIALSPQGEIVKTGNSQEILTSDILKKMYRIELKTTEIAGRKFVLTV